MEIPVPGADERQGEQVEPTAADIAESKEWGDAANDVFPGLSDSTETTSTTTEVRDEQTDTTTTTTTITPPETSTTTTTTTIDPSESPEQKAEREKREADEAAANADDKDGAPDTAARDSRVAARESAKAVTAMAADVREKMFKDAPKVLSDADGDPIRTIADVMKLQNPNTGEAFTEQEAGMWLLAAQQQFNQNLADMDKRIAQIAEVNVDLKDQADMVTYRYGELLKGDTDLRDRLWSEYEKTLVKDPESGIITDMPVNLESFYEIALAPYAKLAETMETQENEAKKAADEAAKKAEEDRKKKERTDRSDIFGRGNIDDMTDPEDREWAEAANVVFGPRKQSK